MLVLRLKAAESYLETKLRITRSEKSRFYPVLAKIRINRGLLYFIVFTMFSLYEVRGIFLVQRNSEAAGMHELKLPS